MILNTESQGAARVTSAQFRKFRIVSLLFADDVILLASVAHDLWQALGWFVVGCETVRMRVNTSEFEAMVLLQKKVDCPSPLGR